MPTVEEYYTSNDAQSHKLLWTFYKKGHIPREEMKTIFNRVSISQTLKREIAYKVNCILSDQYNDFNKLRFEEITTTRCCMDMLGLKIWLKREERKPKEIHSSLRIYKPDFSFNYSRSTLKDITKEAELRMEQKKIELQEDTQQLLNTDFDLFDIIEHLIDKYKLL